MKARLRSTRQSGLTLIELMVAMVLGLLVAAGIVTVFMSTSNSNRAQTQLAHLQEEGRYAMTRIKTDLGMANGQYCSNSGGNAHPTTSGPYLDKYVRAPTVLANGATALMGALSDNTTPWGDGTTYPSQPTAPYSLPSFLSMRGYDCTAAACTPIDPVSVLGAAFPSMGTAVKDRVVGADVLTLRYVDPSRGWSILPVGSATGSTMVTNTDGTLASISLKPLTGEPPITDFKSGDLAMLADCSNAQVFAVDGGGSATLKPNTSNFAGPSGQQNMAAPKVFDFNRDFQTVTYYLKVVDNGDGLGHTTGALVRRVNGADKVLVLGVERLDFKYGVLRPDGSTQFLDAATVDASSSSTGTGCTSAVYVTPGTGTDKGCLWRAVKSIEVSLLMDGMNPLYTLSANEMQYAYSSDTTTTALAAPSAHAIKPSTDQGFPDPMIRREFTALVAVRNFNP